MPEGEVNVEPYAQAARLYRRAGWPGVLPLPAKAKWPPPGGYTGWAGLDPSAADVQAWSDGPEGAGNVALRLPHGVYGLDVDDYEGKTGGAALDALVQRYGPLPATWTVSSRAESVSGIRLFRADLPAGRRWRDEPAGHGAGIEAIHYGHRYAVAWPSIHPDTGATYTWRRPDGTPASDGGVPARGELPELPPAWVVGLSAVGEARTGDMAGHHETVTTVAGWRDGEACQRVRAAHQRGLARLRQARDGAALHPAGRDTTQELVALGHEGHTGARRALAEHYSAFTGVRAGRDAGRGRAEAEWWRMVRGAVGKLSGPACQECDCALRSGVGVQFDWASPAGAPEGARQGASESAPGNAPVAPEGAPEGAGARQGAPEGAQGAPSGDLAGALIARMLTAAQLRHRPGPAPLVEGLLTLDSASWLIARSGSYKSFVALDWAAHVATGRAWMGRDVSCGPVVYVVAEGVAGMGPRIRAWEQRNGTMAETVHFLPMPVQVAREDHWAALVEACRRLAPVLVILDTQARISVGLDENDNSEMGELVEAVERLRRGCGACVLVVHHIGRNGQDARGASAIDGAQDTELRLTRTADRRAVLEIDKSRHADDDVRVELELFVAELDGGGTSLAVGAPLSAVVVPDYRVNLTLNQATLAEVLTDIFPQAGATKAEARAEALRRPRTGPDQAALEPMGPSSFRRAWDSLVGSGRLVRVEGSQRYLLDPAPVEGAGEGAQGATRPGNPWSVSE